MVDNSHVSMLKDLCKAIANAWHANSASATLSLSKDQEHKSLKAMGLAQLNFDQLRISQQNVLNAHATKHKSHTGPKFTCCNLHKVPFWYE